MHTLEQEAKKNAAGNDELKPLPELPAWKVAAGFAIEPHLPGGAFVPLCLVDAVQAGHPTQLSRPRNRPMSRPEQHGWFGRVSNRHVTRSVSRILTGESTTGVYSPRLLAFLIRHGLRQADCDSMRIR